MIGVSTSPVSIAMLRKHNTWYTVIDGSWSDPNVWLSNGKRKNSLPQPGDDVYLDHNIVLDITVVVNNLYASGSLTANINGLNLTVNGDMQAGGAVNFTGSNIVLTLNGYNNYFTGFTAGNSTVRYNRAGDQNVLPVTYKNLVIYNTGIKYLSASTVIQGNLNINDFLPQDAVLECGNYDLTVNGNTSITAANSNSYNFSKNGAGNLIFTGSLNINSNTSFSNNITEIEFRGGFTGGGFGGEVAINCPVKFTTNNQSISIDNVSFNNSVLISGAIELVNTSNSITFYGNLNGDNPNSTLTNNGYLGMGSDTLTMSTGIFNYMNGSTTTIDYLFDGDFTLPFTTYANLKIHGTGLKTLSGNTTISNLTINDFQSYKARLDCSSYDLVVNGSFNVSGTGIGDNFDAGLIKTGSGRITFVGPATFNTANVSFTSNVNLEFRAGANFNIFGAHSGTIDANVFFTTTAQTLQGSAATFNGPVSISGGIILTVSSSGIGHVFNNLINGTSASDTLKNTGTISYQSSSAPMSTGILDCYSTPNNYSYNLNGNQDIKQGTYNNLTLSGGGSKKLLRDVSVKNTYTLLSPATLNVNGFSFTNP